MPTTTTRPNADVQHGTWTLTGGTNLATILSDNLDTTYIQQANRRCRLKNEVAIVGLGDVSLPAGAKIFSVGIRVRYGRVKPTGSGGHDLDDLVRFIVELIEEVFEDVFYGARYNIWNLLFGFFCSKDPSVTTVWETKQLAYYTEAPSGGEWTQDTFNNFTVRLGREDVSTKAGKLGELYADVTYNEKPVATATGPTGSIVDTTRPTITWTYSDPESDPQQAFRVRVFTAAQYGAAGFDPGVSTAFNETDSAVGSGGIVPLAPTSGVVTPWVAGQDLRWAPTRDLPNGTYRAYVKVQQAWNGLGTHESDWSYIQWTQAVPGPPAPVLTATVDNTLNRVRIDMVPASPQTPVTLTYNLEYSDDAGLNWALVRGGLQASADATTQARTIYDYEAPLNHARWYRAQGYRQLSTIKVASDYSNIATATPMSLRYWLKDPLNPSLNTQVVLAANAQGGGSGSSTQVDGSSGDQPNRPRSQGIFAPLVASGYSTFKVAVTGPQYGLEGSFNLLFRDEASWTAFVSIMDSGRTTLFQTPAGENRYVALGGDLSWGYVPQDTYVRVRLASISYTQVATPPDVT